jgi:hypothetical protein
LIVVFILSSTLKISYAATSQVTDFRSSDSKPSTVTLTWTNPPEGDLSEILLLRKETDYATSYTDTAADVILDDIAPVSSNQDSFVDTTVIQGTLYYYSIYSSNGSGTWATTLTEGLNADTGIATGGPVIDIWYGSDQTFGYLGLPQVWVNLLGKVTDPDGVKSLTYSLNGASASSLSIGPDIYRRIYNDGDFNVEIAVSDLSAGSNTVEISATDNLDNITSETVYINYTQGNSWAETYSIDWSTTTGIQDVAQVVDGYWAIESGGVRPVEQGYERIIAIGEYSTWDNYEVTAPVTLHSVESRSYASTGFGPGIGYVIRWQGHEDLDGSQPGWGRNPIGSLGQYRYLNPEGSGSELFVSGSDDTVLDSVPMSLNLGSTYYFKMRAERPPCQGTVYSMKIWQRNEAEPMAWDVSGQVDLPNVEFGSLLLVSHHIDATFGTIDIIPLPDQVDITSPVISNIQVVTGGTGATITWDTDEESTSRTYYGPTVSYGSSINDSTHVFNHTLNLMGLIPGAVYHFSVESTDLCLNVSASADSTFTMANIVLPSAAPALVTDFVVTNNEAGQVIMSWTNPIDPDLAEVVVMRKKGTYPASHSHAAAVQVYQNLAPVSGGSENFVDTTAESNVYYYTVFSRDTAANWNDTVLEGSNADSGQVLDVTPPGIVSGFSATDVEIGQVTLSWTNPADLDLGEVLVLRTESGYATSHTDSAATLVYSGTGTGVVDTTVFEGVIYYYAAFAGDTSNNWNDSVNNWNDSVVPGSNADTGVYNATAPGIVTGLTASDDEVGQVTLWLRDEPYGCDGYFYLLGPR